MMCNVDTSETLAEMRARVGMELVQHLKDGPFFGGLPEPSLIDFAIFPQVVFNHMVGIEDKLVVAQIPAVKKWIETMAQYLPENPMLVPDFMVISPITRRAETQAKVAAKWPTGITTSKN